MPARRDIESVCVIGSGPIVIGQACEFDYAGCQALKVLREDGYRTIVVNSNPATIMTDPGFADRTYIEPLDLESVASVLERERPDALLPTLGGQTALNLAIELAQAGVLEELGVELIGAPVEVIRARRGSRGVPGRRPSLRPGGADLAHRHLARRARGRLPARGRYVRPSPSAATAEASPRIPRCSCARSSAASPSRRSGRCWSRSRSGAGTSSSSR